MAGSRGQPPVPSTAPRAGEGAKPRGHRSIPAAEGASGAVVASLRLAGRSKELLCASRGAKPRRIAEKTPRPPPERSPGARHGWPGWGDAGRGRISAALCRFALAWMSAPGSGMPEGKVSPAPGAAERQIRGNPVP